MSHGEQTMKGDISDFATDMKKLINNKDMSDIRFVIGSTRKPVYAHRCILSARCEVFRAMFADTSQKQNKDGEVPFVLSDMTLDVFLPMLEYIYTNCCTISNKNVVDIMGNAIEYGLDGLKQLCVQFLVKNLSVSTACEAMQAAATYGLDDLRQKAMEYIEQNTHKVFQTKGFHEMSDSALAMVLQSDRLNIDEKDVVDCVREWATVNSVVLSKSVSVVAKKVVNYIRLPLLSPEELQVVEEDNKKDKLLSVESLSYAWRCHALKQGSRDNHLTTKRRGTKDRESHRGLKSL